MNSLLIVLSLFLHWILVFFAAFGLAIYFDDKIQNLKLKTGRFLIILWLLFFITFSWLSCKGDDIFQNIIFGVYAGFFLFYTGYFSIKFFKLWK